MDARIIKTQEAIAKAFFNNLANWTKVKVTNLCIAANRSRITFYHHYDNAKQAIVDAITKQLVLTLPIPRKLKPNSLKSLIHYLIVKHVNYVNEHRQLFSSKYRDDKVKHLFLSTLYDIVQQLVIDEIKPLINNKTDYIIRLTVNSILGYIWAAIRFCIREKRILDADIIWNNYKNLISYQI